MSLGSTPVEPTPQPTLPRAPPPPPPPAPGAGRKKDAEIAQDTAAIHAALVRLGATAKRGDTKNVLPLSTGKEFKWTYDLTDDEAVYRGSHTYQRGSMADGEKTDTNYDLVIRKAATTALNSGTVG